MGLFKDLKDMKDMVSAAPGMIDSAQELGARGNDQSLLPEIAQSHGVMPADWEKAKEGWGARIKDDRALGSKFNALYTSA